MKSAQALKSTLLATILVFMGGSSAFAYELGNPDQPICGGVISTDLVSVTGQYTCGDARCYTTIPINLQFKRNCPPHVAKITFTERPTDLRAADFGLNNTNIGSAGNGVRMLATALDDGRIRIQERTYSNYLSREYYISWKKNITTAYVRGPD